jgi:hypothetical protein
MQMNDFRKKTSKSGFPDASTEKHFVGGRRDPVSEKAKGFRRKMGQRLRESLPPQNKNRNEIELW